MKKIRAFLLCMLFLFSFTLISCDKEEPSNPNNGSTNSSDNTTGGSTDNGNNSGSTDNGNTNTGESTENEDDIDDTKNIVDPIYGSSNLGVITKSPVTIRKNYNYVEAPEEVSYAEEAGRLDVYVNYSGTDGITYRKTTAFNNLVDCKNYTQDTLLPTWVTFAEKTKTTIVDASGYTTQRDNDTYNFVKNNGYRSDKDSSQYIDLFYNTKTNADRMGDAGEAIDLAAHLDDMPNFKAFLEKNPTIKKTIEKNGSIYHTPYFDGYNDVERMFIMDTSLAEKVLDAADFNYFDTTVNGGANPAANVVQCATYTPYMHSVYNYEKRDTTVKALVDNKVEDIKVIRTKNIILQQNELLSTGCTGKELAEQFRTYLNKAYGSYIGEDKIFKSYSDIFCGESAIYNTDELIGLMRVIKANPGVITGNQNAEVETFFPRGQANNRVDNVADLMQIWGVQGITSEKDMLYFDANGRLHDAATTPSTYQALQKLSAIYDEGLILDEFWYKPTTTNATYYLNKYFKKTNDDSGYGFLTFDYSAPVCLANDKVDAIGIDAADRKINVEQKGIKPVLPPLAYWASTTDAKQNQNLTDFTGKTLMRYVEENRSLKSTCWCIPASTDNLAGALRLMDYMFSEKGAMIQDFGPEAYWQKPDVENGDTVEGTYDASKHYVATDFVYGEKTPIMSKQLRAMTVNFGGDVWTFMRAYIGNTHGIGCVRSKSLDIQMTNAYGQIGLVALKNAIAAGVVNHSLVDKLIGTTTWDTQVPTTGYTAVTNAESTQYAALTAFWASDKCAATANGWVAVVAAKAGAHLDNTVLGTASACGDYTYAMVQDQMTLKNKTYLYKYASSLGSDSIPSYTLPNN